MDEYRRNKIAGIREMINFLEVNEDVPLPHFGMFIAFPADDQVSEMARALKPVTKEFGNYYFTLDKKFSENVTLSMHWSRENVCERIVIGTKDIEREVIPERVVEAHTEDIVEWACPDAILSTDKETVSEDS